MSSDPKPKTLESIGNEPVPLKTAIGVAAYLVVVMIILFLGLWWFWPTCEFGAIAQDKTTNSNQNRNGNANQNSNNSNQAAVSNSNNNSNQNANNGNRNQTANPNGNGNQNSNRAEASKEVGIVSVSPNSGPSSGNTQVIIKGRGFKDGAMVRFGGVNGSVLAVLPNESITARTPEHGEGVVDVIVTNMDGSSATLNSGYTYICPAPSGGQLILIIILVGALGGVIHALRSLYWYAGNRELCWSWVPMYILLPFVGAAIALIFSLIVRGGLMPTLIDKGNALALIAIAALVGLFSEQAALKLSQLAEAIFTKPEPGGDSRPQRPLSPDSGGQDTKPDGGTAPKIDPPKGKVAGGDSVKITGTGLSTVKSVTFGDAPATETSIDADKKTITAKTPARAAGPGEVDVVVTDQNDKKSKPMKFKYE